MEEVLELHAFISSTLVIMPGAPWQFMQVPRLSFAASESSLAVTAYSGSWSWRVVVVHFVTFQFTPKALILLAHNMAPLRRLTFELRRDRR